MERVLNVSLRPQRLSDLVGQDATVAAIRKHVANRPPQAWMLVGETGTGKTTLARILALGFQCAGLGHKTAWGDACKDCIENYNRFTIHEINASEVSGVDELGKVAELSRFRPTGSPYRVFILDEFHRVSDAAQNLLLKPFEEPSPTTIWIIATNKPTKVLPTLRRRCTAYTLKPLNDAGSFLKVSAKRAGLTLDLKPLITQVEESEIMSPGILLNALEKFSAGNTALESVAGVDGGSFDTFDVCKALTSGRVSSLLKLLKDSTPDHSRWIQSSTSGWLKSCLFRSNSPKEADKFATALVELNNAPLDDTRLHPWLIATLYRICRRFGATQ